MGIGMEVFEGHVTFIADLVERLRHRRPVRRAVEERSERLQGIIRALLREFLEVNVLRALAQDGYPMLRVLEHRDVARVVMHADVLAAEAVHKRVHLHWRHQESVEENVLHVQRHLQLLRLLRQLPHRLAGAALAHVIRHWLMVGAPGDVDGAGHHEDVLHAEVVRCLRDLAGQLDSPLPLCRIIARERIRPEEERAQPADADADVIRHFANGLALLRASLWRKIIIEIVVQFDAIESGVLRELHAFAQAHLLWIGKGPLVDRFEKRIPLRGSAAHVWRFRLGSAGRLEGQCGETHGSDGSLEGVSTGERGGGRVHDRVER